MLTTVSKRSVIRTVLALVVALALSGGTAQAARKVPQGFFGVNISGSIENAPRPIQAQQWDKLAAAGAESVRVLFNWDLANRVQGGPYNWKFIDRIVINATERHMKLLPTVEYAPAWAKIYPEIVASPPKSPGPYAKFLRAAIKRYGPKGTFWKQNPRLPKVPVRQWQIWNEPEIAFHWYRRPFTRKWEPQDAKRYAALLKASFKAIRDEDPGAKVVLAALSIDSWRSLDKLYRWAGIKGYFDIATLQGYAGKPSFVPTLVHRFRDALDHRGDSDVPLYLTELTWPAAKGKAHPRYTTGYMTDFLTTQSGAAQRLREAYRLLTNKGLRDDVKLKSVLWYLGASKYTGRTEFDYSGLLKHSNTTISQVPAYFAYQNAARAAEGCEKATNGTCR